MTRKVDWNAPELSVTSMHLYGIKSEWYAVLFKVRFLPIHQYPTRIDIKEKEIGSIVKMTKNGRITKVLRRVIHLR